MAMTKVAAASLATFLAVLTLLGAQMRAGHDPALSRPAAVSTVHGTVVTRTSGGTALPVKGSHATHPVTTRTSGGGEVEDD